MLPSDLSEHFHLAPLLVSLLLIPLDVNIHHAFTLPMILHPHDFTNYQNTDYVVISNSYLPS